MVLLDFVLQHYLNDSSFVINPLSLCQGDSSTVDSTLDLLFLLRRYTSRPLVVRSVSLIVNLETVVDESSRSVKFMDYTNDLKWVFIDDSRINFFCFLFNENLWYLTFSVQEKTIVIVSFPTNIIEVKEFSEVILRKILLTINISDLSCYGLRSSLLLKSIESLYPQDLVTYYLYWSYTDKQVPLDSFPLDPRKIRWR